MTIEVIPVPEKKDPIFVENNVTRIDVEDDQEQDESSRKPSTVCSCPEDEYKIDKLFYRICYFSFILGVNFYRARCYEMKLFSTIIVSIHCCINLYFIGYVATLMLSKKFDPDRVATSISMCTWVLQATLSTIFLAFWQSKGQSCVVLKLLYEAHQGVGIHHHRKSLISIVRMFYFVLGFIFLYYIALIVANFLEYDVGYTDPDIPLIFGDRRLFVIVQISNVYCILCWGVALFIFSLLVHSTHFEFRYYNEQVRSLLPHGDRRHSIMEPVCSCDHSHEEQCTVRPQKMKKNLSYTSDEMLCDYLLKLIKIHNRLTECVKRLDKMFHANHPQNCHNHYDSDHNKRDTSQPKKVATLQRYAFVMIATIIPTTLFSLFMLVRRPERYRCLESLFSCPLVFFCVFSFVALVNAPSQLHNTIYNTKSALCANTHIWFPYRPNVYHSALAFVCHLDQTNLGVSIWGFAVVSKPLVLTTLSVMVTCLALFLQLGDCNSEN